MTTSNHLGRIRAGIELARKLDHAERIGRLAAIASIRKGVLTRALICQRNTRHFVYLRDVDQENAYFALLQAPDRVSAFPSEAAAIREVKSLGLNQQAMTFESIDDPKEDDRIRVALIDLFAHVLPGNPKASDWRLIKDVATRDGMQVVTLDGPIQLRPDAGRPQCFSKDVISHGRFVFTTKEHTFAFAVLVERRGWNQQSHYHLFVREIFVSADPVRAEAIDRAPAEFEADWDFPPVHLAHKDLRAWFPPGIAARGRCAGSLRLKAPNGLAIEQLRLTDGTVVPFDFVPPNRYVLRGVPLFSVSKVPVGGPLI